MKINIKKYLTLVLLLTILIAAPLTAPIAYAKSYKPEPTQVTAHIDGFVNDLGIQKYTIEGKSSSGAFIYGKAMFEPEVSFKLEATVIDDVVTGSLKLNVTGKSESSKTQTQLTVNIPIDSGSPGLGCIDGYGLGELIPCPTTPWSEDIVPFLELENGDFIPIFFAGEGEATLKIGKETTTYTVYVVVDTSTAQHPFIGGPEDNNGRVTLTDMYGSFAFDVDVKKFKVDYKEVVMLGEVTGDLEGLLIQTANSKEDHVKGVQKDDGYLSFSVIRVDTGDAITMSGSYKGDSIQAPLLGYLYYSTGKFTTSGDMEIKGTYDTLWYLPLFWTSTFTGTVK
ncbi:hypothetical protein ACFL96_18095 [Thermoproteota archaeon]